MFYPIIFLALTGGEQDCDHRAAIAGHLMILHQSGAAPQAVAAAAVATALPDFAASLVERVVSAETSADAPARELAAFHFAAEIHAACTAPGPRVS